MQREITTKHPTPVTQPNTFLKKFCLIPVSGVLPNTSHNLLAQSRMTTQVPYPSYSISYVLSCTHNHRDIKIYYYHGTKF